jgi:DNA-binding MarR family transcriptional regulator
MPTTLYIEQMIFANDDLWYDRVMNERVAETMQLTMTPGPGGLGWTLAMVLRAWQERVEAVLDDLPHGGRGFLVLSTVVHEQPPTQAALAARLAMDRTVLTYLLDDLEAAGLVARVAVPNDRRARRIEATSGGNRALAAAEGRVAEAEAIVLGGLTPDERARFSELAHHAAMAILRSVPGTDPCIAVRDVMDRDQRSAATS